MHETPIFKVQKFFPPRCPKCEHEFGSVEDFAEYVGAIGSSFLDAKFQQAKRNPELFETVGEAGSAASAGAGSITRITSSGPELTVTDRFSSDFIIYARADG